MREFSVLHLSDLHIKGKNLSKTLDNLLKDIKEQALSLNKIIIVVSGDIIDRGDYAKNKNGSIIFFQKLKDTLSDKVIDIHIVPGNHDRIRNTQTSLSSMAMQSNQVKGTIDEWKVQEEGCASFLELSNNIYKIFKKKKKLRQTFGVEVLKVYNMNVAIIRMDSSWISYGAPDENHSLIIGEYQREQLIADYQKIVNELEAKNENITLTFAIAHHPISYLKPSEEDKVKECLINNEYLNVDYFMCGHTHERAISNWFNHERALTTLITGIGWDHNDPKIESLKTKEEHRYSIYLFDYDNNVLDIIMRKTQINGVFDYDYSLYISETEKNTKKIFYPLKFRQEHPYMPLNALNSTKHLFVDNYILEIIKSVSIAQIEFRVKCTNLCERYKHDYLECLLDFMDINSKEYKDAYVMLYDRFFDPDSELILEEDPIFLKEPNISYEHFTSYLQELLNYFAEIFSQCFDSDVDLRTHFRLYNEENDTYDQICRYSNKESGDTDPPRSMPWGGLIEHAFKTKSAVVYSANKDENILVPPKWDDFITVVPKFHKYEIHKRKKQGGDKIRPILSFGVSVKSPLHDTKFLSPQLHVMEFLGIDDCLKDIIDEFVKYFPVDYSKYSNYRNNQINKAAIKEE